MVKQQPSKQAPEQSGHQLGVPSSATAAAQHKTKAATMNLNSVVTAAIALCLVLAGECIAPFSFARIPQPAFPPCLLLLKFQNLDTHYKL